MADSAAVAMATTQEPGSVVKVVPEQFKIDVVLNEEVFLELTLHNTSASLCTFKVKTTARDRYLLRPTQDYIQPHGSRVCKIVMSPMRAYPDLTNPKNLKDKFLVQATNIDSEVADLTKFWKELETQHNPKAGLYKYAETKIKCKLSVPAKYRAADATKRGEEAEQAAAAAAAATAERNAQMAAMPVMQQQQQQQQQPQQAMAPAPVAQPLGERVDEMNEGARRKPSNDAADFAAMALSAPPSQQQQQQQPVMAAPVPIAATAPVTLVPMSSPAVAAAIAAATGAAAPSAPAAVSSSSGVASSQDALALSRQLSASEAKYAELMEFVVKTTAQLEKERAERESWEGRAQQAAQALAQTQIRLDNTEAKLSAARDDLKRAASSSSHSGSSSLVSGKVESSEGATRRHGKSEGKDGSSSVADDEDRSSTAKKLAAATAAVSPPAVLTGSGSSGGALASKQPAGLTLPLWQIALMALVCFVLGRIFG